MSALPRIACQALVVSMALLGLLPQNMFMFVVILAPIMAVMALANRATGTCTYVMEAMAALPLGVALTMVLAALSRWEAYGTLHMPASDGAITGMGLVIGVLLTLIAVARTGDSPAPQAVAVQD